MRLVRCSLIQATNAAAPESSLEATKKAMVDKHVAYIEKAAGDGAQIVCLQEIFYGPYFCAEQTTRWYDFTERIPDGPTVRLMQELARRLKVALIVPIYEIEHGISEIAGAEIELLPEARRYVGDVGLPVFAEIGAVVVDDSGGVVIDAVLFHFIDWNYQRHVVLAGEVLH